MIDKLNSGNLDRCISLANELWPNSEYSELVEEFNKIIKSNKEECFLYSDNKNGYIAFMQLSIRSDYVEGSSFSPVAYIEGIYVKKIFRKKGIGHKLIKEAEIWANEKECKELASDCELNNELSIKFHNSIGFKEANRVVCFIKKTN